MPIFEFKCLKCNHLREIIITNSSQQIEMKCEKCGSEELQRVISKTSYIMGSDGNASIKTTTKQCGPGNSCTTYEIPGYQK